MSSLLALPVEILQNIIGQVSPDDLVNFFVSCKQIFRAAERPLLKHRERIETYSELQYSGCFRRGDGDDGHPVTFLREICLDEYISFYPRILKITCGEFPEDIEDYVSELSLKHRSRKLIREAFDDSESAIDEKLSKALCYNEKNINIWRQEFKRGARSAVLGLLLLLLPNLEELYFTHLECDGVMIKRTLELIAGGIHDPDNISAPVALTKLSKVWVRGPEGNRSGCQVLVPFAALPSLRTLTARWMFGNRGSCLHLENLDWPYEQHFSGLTVLDLQSSYLGPADFSHLLGGIKGLKSFTYDCHFYDYRGYRSYGNVPVRSIIGILLEHAKHSLQSATFSGLGDGRCNHDHGSGSFRGFEVLEQIRMHSGYYLKDVEAYNRTEHGRFNNGETFSDREKIFGLWYDDVERLVDLLPASVRSVELNGRVDAVDITTLLKELPKRKAQCVPHLESINFTGSPPWEYENDYSLALAQTWREECRKVGVDLLL